MARKYHPDLNPNDPTAKDKFQAVNEANEVLSDPENVRNMMSTVSIGNMPMSLRLRSVPSNRRVALAALVGLAVSVPTDMVRIGIHPTDRSLRIAQVVAFPTF